MKATIGNINLQITRSCRLITVFAKISGSICILLLACFSNIAAQGIQNSGNLYIGPAGNIGVLGSFSLTNTSSASYLNDGNVYLYGDFTNYQPAMSSNSGTGNGDGSIWFQGSNIQALNGTKPFKFYQMHLNKTNTTDLVNMSMDVTVKNNLTLTKGILTTGTNLFTWYNNGGTLTAPNTPWVAHSGSYADSYIATCDASGTPISVAGPTSAFTGTAGVQIDNISSSSGDVYFPVGASYIAAGTSFTPTPNRLMIHNNSSTPDNFTVVVNYGDIGRTPNPRVNRIWYINAGLTTDKVTMKLFFTERDPSHFYDGTAASQNEVESGFSYVNDIYLGEKDYVGNPNFIALSGSTDVQSFPSGTYPYGEEVYGLYTVGVSQDVAGNKNGITDFNRFTLINNSGGIILAVNVTSLRAWQQGNNIALSWVSSQETGINHYEVEKSTDGINFGPIGSVPALNSASGNAVYHFTDFQPASGNNFYRIKIVDNNGQVTYTSIALVTNNTGKPEIFLFPNPVKTFNFTLQMSNLPAGQYELRVMDNLGQVMVSKTISHPGGSASQTIYLPTGTARGTYHLTLTNGPLTLNRIFLLE